MNNTTEIYWTARNNSTFMTTRRSASTMRAAVRDARSFLTHELFGEGVMEFYDTPNGSPIRADESSIHTGYKMVIKVRVGHELVTKQ